MAGLYIHIPFCKSRCSYCAFYSTTQLESRQRYVDAVCREMEILPPPLSKGRGSIDTVYLGGGTPSQLTREQLQQFFIYINKVYQPSANAEVTIEVNPDDVTDELCDTLQKLPVNRVSMGIQTFNDSRLRFLNRRHSAKQAVMAVSRLRNAGIRNISIDLMYGFPNETLDDWMYDIDRALTLDVEHLSAYCLMIEEGTVLYEQMNKKASSDSLCLGEESKSALNREDLGGSEELERQMYELLIDKLTAAGYEHYEISNFARPGYRSRHNSSYWHDVPYIGLGAAAHSYDLKKRQWNISDIKQYIEAVERGEIPCESEQLDDDTRYNDRITVALRTSEGLDISNMSERHRRYCLREAQRFISDGLLREHDNHLVLTRKGLFVSDMIMSSLMIV